MPRTREETHAAFASRFSSSKRSKPITDAQLDEINTALSTNLPTSYRDLLKTHGVLWTPSILKQVAALEAEHPDLQEFLKPKDVIKFTKMIRSGDAPENLIVFANDCSGSMFAFEQNPNVLDDAPVQFFDHEYGETKPIANTLDESLSWYLDHLPSSRS